MLTLCKEIVKVICRELGIPVPWPPRQRDFASPTIPLRGLIRWTTRRGSYIHSIAYPFCRKCRTTLDPHPVHQLGHLSVVEGGVHHARHLRDQSAAPSESVDLMSRLENGQGSVRLDKALAVLDGLGLTLMELPSNTPGRARQRGRAS